MEAEHSREDELLIQMIGLQGIIDKLKKEKYELIVEFLRDWRWGRTYEMHFSWLNYYDHCRCKPTIIEYWKWFEQKWEAKRK